MWVYSTAPQSSLRPGSFVYGIMTLHCWGKNNIRPAPLGSCIGFKAREERDRMWGQKALIDPN